MIRLLTVYPRNYDAIFAASSRDTASKIIKTRSSNIWGYYFEIKDRHNKTGTLYIQFKSKYGGPGDLYCYYNVLPRTYQRLITAPSKGHFFWLYIRNQFPYSKLTGDKKGTLRNAIN